MRRTWIGLALAFFLLGGVASAEVTFRDGKIYFNGERQEHVLGRTSFKLAPMVSYHYAGRGGGHWSLGRAHAWVLHNQRLFGRKHVWLRTFLETGKGTDGSGWEKCEPPELQNDGVPQNCMFGSEPFDQGFWNVDALRTGNRPTELTALGKRVVEWFFQESEETGAVFELVIIATVKHSGISVPTQTHVVRQALAYMREMQAKYPQALIVADVINEWNAHSEWSLPEVNMLAVRGDRWKHQNGSTVSSKTNPGEGWEPEQWPGGPFVVDGGGGNTFDYDVGPEAGKFRMGLVHPDRGPGWERFPTEDQLAQLRRDARGMPVGANESKYFIDPADEARARGWYNWAEDRGCCTTDLATYTAFMERLCSIVELCVFHDEKGAESDVDWPRPITVLETWLLATYGGEVEPPPPPPEKKLYFDAIVDSCYRTVLGRPVDPSGLGTYNEYLRSCVPGFGLAVCIDKVQESLFESEEYRSKFYR